MLHLRALSFRFILSVITSGLAPAYLPLFAQMETPVFDWAGNGGNNSFNDGNTAIRASDKTVSF